MHGAYETLFTLADPDLHHDVFPVLVLHEHLRDHVNNAPHVVRAQGDLGRVVVHAIQQPTENMRRLAGVVTTYPRFCSLQHERR